MAKKKEGISRLLEIAGEKTGLLALSSVLSFISALLQLVPFIAIYFITAEILNNAADPTAINVAHLNAWGWGTLASLVLFTLIFFASIMASHVAAFRIIYTLRLSLCRYLARLPLGYHTNNASGVIQKTLQMNVENTEQFIAHQLPDFITAAVTPLLIFAALFWLDWRLALVCLIPIVFCFVIQFLWFFSAKSKDNMKMYQDKLEQMNAAGVEYIRGMPAVKVFGLTVDSFLSFRNAILGYRDWAIRFSIAHRHNFTLFMTVLTSLGTFILPISGMIFSKQPQDLAFALTLILFLLIAPGLALSVLKITYLGGQMRMISEGVNRIDAIFDQKPIAEPTATTAKIPSKSNLSFYEVSFSYQDHNAAIRNKALDNVSFNAPEGCITALVGPSGSGKSTIGSLAARFWDPDQGSITIGDIDLREMGTDTLMQNLSFVFQDSHLFYDTIEENIRMGNKNASQEQLLAVAKAACCDEFIKQLPKGYQTKIGEEGVYLSGGQTQRICIARAILKDAPILILDEATAYADPENEQKIEQALQVLIHNKTVIIIAHRLSTIQHAEQIIVINEGKIEGSGTHAELLSRNGLYSRMWLAHNQAVAWQIHTGEQDETIS